WEPALAKLRFAARPAPETEFRGRAFPNRSLGTRAKSLGLPSPSRRGKGAGSEGVAMRRLLMCCVLALVPGLAAAPAQEEAKGPDRAVERGVTYLRGLQQADGTWPHREIGATALAAVTLLECGAARDDDAVQKAARAVRQRAPTLTHTYS